MLKRFEKFQPVLIAFVSLCILVFIILRYTEFSNDKKEKDSREKLLELLVSKKSQLEKSLSSRIYYTKGIAAYCSINPDITDDVFYRLANELINKDSVISSMALSRNCVLNAIYPYKGHESAIGLNLLEHPQRRKIVESTIKTRQTFVAGPVELIEGGVAFISYTPIFTDAGADSSKFWGVTDIVILKDQLFNEINLQPEDGNYKYALRGNDGSGIKGSCFWGDDKVFSGNPVTVDVYLPTGNWTLASVPVNGWANHINKTERITIILYISAVIISILIWLLTRAMLKIRAHEQELKALFGSMQDLIIVFSSKGEYLKIAPTNEALLIKPSKELLGSTLHDIFDKQMADYFLNAIQEALETKKMVAIDYPLTINGKESWFTARISYMTDDTVIYVAHDNTNKKLAEENLRQSEQKLKELNAAKDKFFSIIAHDLRGPFFGFMGISAELKNNVDQMEKDEIAELATVMHSAAEKTFGLLNNLLDWSRLQTGRMILEPEELNLYKETEEICGLFNPAASVKSISIVNNVDKDIRVLADKNALSTVLRNLVSNAIKFTAEGGVITLFSAADEKYASVSVRDTGTGMKEDVQKKIFMIDSNYSTKGTNGEEGTGLGLVLCRELVEKSGGSINVSSIPSQGTTFTVILPAYETVEAV